MLKHVLAELNTGFASRPRWQQQFVLQLGRL